MVETIGARMYRARRAVNMSVVELSIETQIPSEAIVDVEADRMGDYVDRHVLTYDKLERIAKALCSKNEYFIQ